MSRKSQLQTPEDFWAMAQPDASGCWLWTGTIHKLGYGRAGYQGKTYIASRLAYELTHGAIPDGFFVCHHCDVRACVNPAHLFLGTAADNNEDRTAKGRSAKKLSAEDVDAIRLLYASGRHTMRALAARFGVTHPAVVKVIHGRSHTY